MGQERIDINNTMHYRFAAPGDLDSLLSLRGTMVENVYGVGFNKKR